MKWILVALALCSGTTLGFATDHSGDITSSEDWNFLNNPHNVVGDLTVHAGATLSMGTGNSYDLTYDGQYGACGNRQGDLYYFTKDSNTPIWQKVIGSKVHTVAISDYGYGFSHPNEPIWEYKATAYDEVFVGYDKHPHGEPNEPVFRYSVRLPEDMWFRQPDYNEVFWLSVQAVYDFNQPNYPWG